MIQPIEQLKKWFETGKYPTQEQFSDWMDSYWHKNESIPLDSIDGLNLLITELIDNIPSLQNAYIDDNGDLIMVSSGGSEVNIGHVAGKTAYQYAVEGGYQGTEAEFRATMTALAESVTIMSIHALSNSINFVESVEITDVALNRNCKTIILLDKDDYNNMLAVDIQEVNDGEEPQPVSIPIVQFYSKAVYILAVPINETKDIDISLTLKNM